MISNDYGEEGIGKFRGCIGEEVDVRNDGIRYVFEFEKVLGKVLVYGPRYPLYEYGNCLEITGRLLNPENKGDFDYVNYLKRYGIYKIMYVDSMKLLQGKSGNFFFKYVYLLKNVVEKKLNGIFVEPYKSFMAGLLMGSRRGLPQHLTNDFKKVGLSHIMAISGYNITLVIVMISGIFWFLKKNVRVIVSSVFVVIFVIFVGMSASAVRAAIMGILGLFALKYERKYDVARGLLITVFVVSLWNPLIFFYDAGFQLSALATGGLIYIYPWLKERLKMFTESFGIRETIGGSLSAQIAVLPIMIFNFKQMSILGVFANVLILPLIPLVMLTGFMAIILSFGSNNLGMIIGFLAYLLMKLIVVIIELFAKIPFVNIEF
jgi:competence protein ComEC